MGSISRDIYTLSARRIPAIDIVYGSAVPIHFNMMDITIPDGAAVVFYAQQQDGPVYRADGWKADNTAGFTPPEGFFKLGYNHLQVEINGKIIPVAIDVKCHERLSGAGSEATPEQVRPLVEQALSAAREANSSQLAAAGSAYAAAGSAEDAGKSAADALQSKNAAAGSADAADGSAQEAAESKEAAAGSASDALQSKNEAAESAQEALTSKNAAASSADSAAGSASAAEGSAGAAAESAEDALESKNAAAGSAQEAQEALEKTQKISVNPAFIGDNGNWFVWNVDQDSYVDSGVKAQGPQGVPGTGNVSSVCGVNPGNDGNVVLNAENVGARPDSWMPTAADVGALPLSGGNMTGGISMSGHPISGLNDPTEDTQAANKGYVDAAVRKAAPRNLLDNSDFTNLVAQADIGGNHGSIAYAADRWILDSGTASYEAGVGLTLSGTIRQKLEFTPTGETSVFVGMASGTSSISYADGAVTITSSGGVIKWAALYEGSYTAETLPEYQPKGYAAELLECQRYFYRANPQKSQYCGFGACHADLTQSFLFLVLPIALRAEPSIAMTGRIILTNGETQFNSSSATLDRYCGDNIIKITLLHDANEQHRGVFLAESDFSVIAYIDIIADL